MRRTGVAADYAVLGVLAAGGLLTVKQLAREASVTSWSARAAVSRLEASGLIVDTRRQGRWEITQRGRGEWAVKGKRFTL
ncbi:MarR family transcriptional regulator [Nocardia sp. NPDC020380]|uniref:MarR family transcriptional regulator n=1 Tax=Nocardia sp. NPDC020380 TaxID=3364309 RepID=UPI003791027D